MMPEGEGRCREDKTEIKADKQDGHEGRRENKEVGNGWRGENVVEWKK